VFRYSILFIIDYQYIIIITSADRPEERLEGISISNWRSDIFTLKAESRCSRVI